MTEDECEKICDQIKEELSWGDEIRFYAKRSIEIIRQYSNKDDEAHSGYVAKKKLEALQGNITQIFKFLEVGGDYLPFEPEPDTGSDDADNLATDRWGGAGPDCKPVPEGVRTAA